MTLIETARKVKQGVINTYSKVQDVRNKNTHIAAKQLLKAKLIDGYTLQGAIKVVKQEYGKKITEKVLMEIYPNNTTVIVKSPTDRILGKNVS